jgi:uncharacterized protein YyaL (SSP411 family)
MAGSRGWLLGVSEAYRQKPDEVRNSIAQILAGLQQGEQQTADSTELPADLRWEAARALTRHYDDSERRHRRRAEVSEHDGVLALPPRLAHDRRARIPRHGPDDAPQDGGGWNQRSDRGGFHRYSVDARWLVPHFEKMLYDNALLVRLYLEGYQATGDPASRRSPAKPSTTCAAR